MEEHNEHLHSFAANGFMLVFVVFTFYRLQGKRNHSEL